MTHELPEEDIINAIREGNTVAFQHVFDSLYESLCGYAFSVLRNSAEAEDVVQSAFMKLWEKRDVLEIRQSVKSYLFRAVYNQCLNQIEHRAVKSRFQAYSQLEATELSGETEPFPDELDQKVRVAVDNLPPQCKKIFMMSRYEGLRYPEIASRLNISVNTIQNQICKALRILRTELRGTAGS